MPPFRTVLVLCEGNHCRSTIAEGLLRHLLDDQVQVSSAGLGALVGHPAHPEAQKMMSEIGLDIGSHRGRQLTPDLALAADLILVMDESQREACHRMIPATRGRVYLLGHWLRPGEQEIPDPIKRGPEVHRQVFVHIQRAVSLWLPRLNLQTPRNP